MPSVHAETPWAPEPLQQLHYAPRSEEQPSVAIVTDTRGRQPDWTVLSRSVLEQSLQSWRWYIVCTSEQAQLIPADLLADNRVRVGIEVRPGEEHYVCQLDAESSIGPTFLEKCVWVLGTNKNAAFCNTHSAAELGDGTPWIYGFEQGVRFLEENYAGPTCVFRLQAFAIGAGDVPTGLATWERWLRLANAGLWGITIPEVLTRYPHIDRTAPFRAADIEQASRFRSSIRQRYTDLEQRFPSSALLQPQPYAHLAEDAPVSNLLEKPAGVKRLLIIMPWLIVGGAERVNLDMVRSLTESGRYEVSIATTMSATHSWAAEFARYTPDIFLLDRMLHPIDYARFLASVIESRQVDLVLISNSYVGYLLLPYLRARHPQVAFVDLCHSFEESWKNGGYPRCGAAYQEQLDLNITASEYVKRWMVGRGAEPERIEVCYTNIDTEKWQPDQQARVQQRAALGLADDQALIMFHGRLSPEKRPAVMARIIARLRETVGERFACIVIGDGPERASLEQQIAALGIGSLIQLAGRLSDSDLHRYLAAADILLLPSQVEGISVSTFESMAMGIVPVSADVGGQRELVTPDCGFVVAHGPNEIDEYVAILQRLVLDGQLRQEMGRRARLRVEQEFPLSAFGPRMAALFERALALHSSSPRPSVNLGLAREHAVQSIEGMRLEQAVAELWADRDRWQQLAQSGGMTSGPARGESINRIWFGLAPLYRWSVAHGLTWLAPLKQRTVAWIQRRGL